MARFPSGIVPLAGEDVEDVRARIVQMTLDMEAHPLGMSAPCMNPECAGPVDYVGAGTLTLYCSATCRNRAADLRRDARNQLALVERTLAEAHYRREIPREQLRARARLLRWWLARLATSEERDSATVDVDGREEENVNGR